LGYFNLARLKAQTKRGEYGLSRYQINTAVFDEHGQPVELPGLFNNTESGGGQSA
jgi:hypothetical protein